MASGFKYFMTVIGIIASVGYIIQVQHVSIIYFDYKVENHYSIKMPLVMPMPRLHVCINLIDALDRKKLLANLNMDMRRIYDPGFDDDEYFMQLKQLTVKQMFQYTPSVDEILVPNGDACRIRYPYLYLVKSFPDSICSQFVMNISKYLHREQVCYKFDVMTPDRLKAVYPGGKMPQLQGQNYGISPDKPYLVYEIYLNQELFPSLTSLTAYIVRPGSSELQGSFSATIFRIDSSISPPGERIENITDGEREENQADIKTVGEAQRALVRKLSRIKMDFWKYSSNRLPPPYFTKCENIPGFKTVFDYALHMIDEKSTEIIGLKTPFGFIHDSQSELKVLSIPDLENATFMKIFARISKNINVTIFECHVEVTVTTSGSQSIQDDKLSVAVMWPKSNNVETTYVPYQLLSEYIIFMFSCSGFWFGTSFLTIWSDLISIKNFYSKSSKSRKVVPSDRIKQDELEHEQSIFIAIERLVHRMNFLVRKISTIEEKMIGQDTLWQQINQLQSDFRTHGAFIDTLMSRTNERTIKCHCH